MIELTYKFLVVYKDNKLIFLPDENGVKLTYPSEETEYKEFDTYKEAQTFIKENNLIKKDYTVIES